SLSAPQRRTPAPRLHNLAPGTLPRYTARILLERGNAPVSSLQSFRPSTSRLFEDCSRLASLRHSVAQPVPNTDVQASQSCRRQTPPQPIPRRPAAKAFLANPRHLVAAV